jgi:hypothetical protein
MHAVTDAHRAAIGAAADKSAAAVKSANDAHEAAIMRAHAAYESILSDAEAAHLKAIAGANAAHLEAIGEAYATQALEIAGAETLLGEGMKRKLADFYGGDPEKIRITAPQPNLPNVADAPAGFAEQPHGGFPNSVAAGAEGNPDA